MCVTMIFISVVIINYSHIHVTMIFISVVIINYSHIHVTMIFISVVSINYPNLLEIKKCKLYNIYLKININIKIL